MKLAKPYFDVGLFTTNPEPLIAFWAETAGAVFDHVLPVARGHKQHRMDLKGSVLKINAVRELEPAPPGPYAEVLVAKDGVTTPTPFTDPDGNRGQLVPPGWRGVKQIAVVVRSSDPAAHARYYRNALELPEVEPGAFAVGESLYLVESGGSAAFETPMAGPGWRYTTIQIFNTETEHARYLAAGGRPGTPVQRLGDVARIAMVRDPDGAWIEFSQRASLTGSLD